MEKDLKDCERMRAQERAKGNKKELIKVCNYLGSMYSSRGDFRSALEAHREELSIAQELEDEAEEALASRRLGEVYAEMEKFDSALRYVKEFLFLAEKLSDKVEIQRAWATLGRTYFLKYNASDSCKQETLASAKKAFRNALKLTDDLKQTIKERDYAEMKCRSCLNLALVYELEENKERACQCFTSAIFLAKKHGFKEDLYRCQLNMANFFQKTSSFPDAIRLFDEAVSTAESMKDKTLIADAHMCKAQLLIERQDYRGARQQVKAAYHLKPPAEEDREKALEMLQLLTLVLNKLKKLDSESDGNVKMKLWDKLGDTFVALKSFKVAIDYYRKELDMAISLDFRPDELALIYVSLGQTYLDCQRYQEALASFEEELKCRKDNEVERIKSWIKIVECKIHLGQSRSEIQADYEKQLLTLTSDTSRRLLLADYATYLTQHHRNSSRRAEIQSQLDALPPTSPEDEAVEHVLSSDEDELRVSDISSMSSGGEEDEEKANARKTHRSHRSRSKISVKVNEKGESALHRACIDGKVKQVEKLLSKDHPVNLRDHCGWSPLHEACNHGFPAIVELLIDHGADINDPGGALCEGTTPLHDACTNGNVDVIRVLLRKGANVTALNHHGLTPRDCLLRMQDELDEDEYKPLLDELENRMKRLGYDFSRRPKESSKQKYVPRLMRSAVEISSRRGETVKEDVNYENPRDVRQDYRHVMTTLRVGVTDDEAGRTKNPKKPMPSLMDEADTLNDDWLEDDIGISSKKCSSLTFDRKTKTSKRKRVVKANNHETIEDVQDVQEVADSDEEKAKKVKATEPDPHLNPLSNRSIKDRTDRSEKQQLMVTIQDKCLKIVVPNRNARVSWLQDVVAKRYHEIHHCRPVLNFETDGAMLSNEDLICDVIEKHVTAIVERLVHQSLTERYRELCRNVSLTELDSELKVAEETGTLDLNSVHLPSNQLGFLFGTINNQSVLRKLDISNSTLLCKEFMEVICRLPALESLNMECSGVTTDNVECLAKNPMMSICSINLNYNRLSSIVVPYLILMMESCPKLGRIQLKHSCIKDDLLSSSDLQVAIRQSHGRISAIRLEPPSVNDVLSEFKFY